MIYYIVSAHRNNNGYVINMINGIQDTQLVNIYRPNDKEYFYWTETDQAKYLIFVNKINDSMPVHNENSIYVESENDEINGKDYRVAIDIIWQQCFGYNTNHTHP